MGIYGVKDVASMVLFDKETGEVLLSTDSAEIRAVIDPTEARPANPFRFADKGRSWTLSYNSKEDK